MTMTGELVDLFDNRMAGVRQIADAVAARFAHSEVRIYAGAAGFVAPDAAAHSFEEVASANWHAAAAYVAAPVLDGIFLDVGSTTTDVVPFAQGLVQSVGCTDDQRLAADELVYSGVVRTPVMALADRVPFAGNWVTLMAELFATAADVHRLTGELPANVDQSATTDGRPKTVRDSARRLARMIGRDLETVDMAAWHAFAGYLAERQRQIIQDAVARTLSRGLVDSTATACRGRCRTVSCRKRRGANWAPLRRHGRPDRRSRRHVGLGGPLRPGGRRSHAGPRSVAIAKVQDVPSTRVPERAWRPKAGRIPKCEDRRRAAKARASTARVIGFPASPFVRVNRTSSGCLWACWIQRLSAFQAYAESARTVPAAVFSWRTADLSPPLSPQTK